MPLKIDYIRQGGRIIGSATSGFSDESTTVRDQAGRILGHTSDRFRTTRDAAGRLLSSNSPSPGLLIPQKK